MPILSLERAILAEPPCIYSPAGTAVAKLMEVICLYTSYLIDYLNSLLFLPLYLGYHLHRIYNLPVIFVLYTRRK